MGEHDFDAGQTVPGVQEGADPDLARLSEAVRERRTQLGLSQRAFAELAGVSLGTATRLERGFGLPRVSNLPKLEDALQWPRGILQAMRRGASAPVLPAVSTALSARSVVEGEAAGDDGASAALRSASLNAQVLGIASAVVSVAGVCMDVLSGESADLDEVRAQALRRLDAQLRGMESLIAASLPDAESFDDTMAVLRELHHHRKAIQHAAAQ